MSFHKTSTRVMRTLHLVLSAIVLGVSYAQQEIITDVDECATNATLCQPRGTCVNSIGSFTCNCLQAYTGLHCETELTGCESEPCQNGGTCSGKLRNFVCNCGTKFFGVVCETERPVEPCKNSSCFNGGYCRGTATNYQCICQLGFTGRACVQDVDECTNEPCENLGTCENTVGSYKCHCSGWTGHHCDQKLKKAETQQEEAYFLAYIFAAVIGGILLIACVVAIVCMYQRWQTDLLTYTSIMSDEGYGADYNLGSQISLGSRHSMVGRSSSRHSMAGRSVSRHGMGGRSGSQHSMGGRSGSRMSLDGRGLGGRRGMSGSRQSLAMMQSLHDIIRTSQMDLAQRPLIKPPGNMPIQELAKILKQQMQPEPEPDLLALARALQQSQVAAPPKPEHKEPPRAVHHELALKHSKMSKQNLAIASSSRGSRQSLSVP